MKWLIAALLLVPAVGNAVTAPCPNPSAPSKVDNTATVITDRVKNGREYLLFFPKALEDRPFAYAKVYVSSGSKELMGAFLEALDGKYNQRPNQFASRVESFDTKISIRVEATYAVPATPCSTTSVTVVQ